MEKNRVKNGELSEVFMGTRQKYDVLGEIMSLFNL